PPVAIRIFWYSTSSPDCKVTVCAAGSTAATSASSLSTSSSSYQSAGRTNQPSSSSSDRRYVFDRGGRPNGTVGSRLVRTTPPRYPSSLRVPARVPPALPPPSAPTSFSPAG